MIKDFFASLCLEQSPYKKNHSFYYQVQGQMGVSGRKWCGFVVWTLKGMSVEKIMFDEAFWEKMV